MNLFRLAGDMLHLASIFILLLKIWGTKNCRGISFKTQLLYVIVFCCRYIDIFWNFHSLYNTVMKIVFIMSASATAYLIKMKDPYNKTYDAESDNFNILYILVPCACLAMVWNVAFTPFEVIWAFSIYTEAFVIVPQILMVQKFASEHQGSIENLTSDYMFCLGSYRALYLINWVYRYSTQGTNGHYWDPIVWTAGIIQTAIYSDFLYYYMKARWASKAVSLPV